MISGGPARLNVALKFGRSMKRTLVTDEDKPRNRVTLLSNDYLTQDAVRPTEFKKAKADVVKYKDVAYLEEHVIQIISV
ncbi:hypothetical protein [Staphylococcus xylosus]|uniref:hypothetical protein n=1 Tax=Staphylococcus xylosus TaxID=1288 RepID=UPI0018E34F0D|nr:hypothetical protein [Staphylococcus xylosus]